MKLTIIFFILTVMFMILTTANAGGNSTKTKDSIIPIKKGKKSEKPPKLVKVGSDLISQKDLATTSDPILTTAKKEKEEAKSTKGDSRAQSQKVSGKKQIDDSKQRIKK